MAEQRIFPAGDVDLTEFGKALEEWFRLRDLETQVFGDGAKMVTVQARTQQDWRRFVGASTALSVTATRQGDNLLVQMGAAKWADKVGAGVAALIVFWPLAALPAYGAYKQKQLIDEAFQFIEQYVAMGGSPFASSPTRRMPERVQEPASVEPVEAATICPSCGEAVAAGAKFCAQCGAVLQRMCPSCGAVVAPGARLCSACGAKMGA